MQVASVLPLAFRQTTSIGRVRFFSIIHDTNEHRPSEEENNAESAQRKARWHRTQRDPTFVDTHQLHVRGGQGGDGCVSFAREKFKPFGPPSGAGGGQGGSIFIRAKLGLSSLARMPGQVVAERGTNGTGDWQPGRRGRDRVIEVPVGTVVRVQYTRSDEEQDVLRCQYEDRLRRKYRGAFCRQRRLRLFTSQDDVVASTDYAADQLRLQRDAVWRHYAGAMGHSSGAQKDGAADETDLDESVEGEGEEEESWMEEDAGQSASDDLLIDAESDIRALGSAFREAEKRLAFTLLDREMANHAVNKTEEGDAPLRAWSVDLDEETKEPVQLVNGGHGGLGNAFFAGAKNRSPTLATRGANGEQAIVRLEWKFKGDVGLIGLPNAGKSTFLKSVCATGDDVRVAGYAFTTITPHIGVVRLSETGLIGVSSEPIEESLSRDQSRRSQEGQVERDAQESNFYPETSRFILQDLPGLVRGASENRGLGHDFLKHIERCLALYYVVDVSEAATSPWDDVELVFRELELYRKGLSRKVCGLIANKCDAIVVEANSDTSTTDVKVSNERDGLRKLQRLRDRATELHGRRIPVWSVSAKYRIGVENTARAMARSVELARIAIREQR